MEGKESDEEEDEGILRFLKKKNKFRENKGIIESSGRCFYQFLGALI